MLSFLSLADNPSCQEWSHDWAGVLIIDWNLLSNILLKCLFEGLTAKTHSVITSDCCCGEGLSSGTGRTGDSQGLITGVLIKLSFPTPSPAGLGKASSFLRMNIQSLSFDFVLSQYPNPDHLHPLCVLVCLFSVNMSMCPCTYFVCVYLLLF